MVPAFDFKVQPNPALLGMWRLTMKLFFEENGKKKLNCFRYRLDIVEV